MTDLCPVVSITKNKQQTLMLRYFTIRRCLAKKYQIRILVKEKSMSNHRLYEFVQEVNDLLTAYFDDNKHGNMLFIRLLFI